IRAARFTSTSDPERISRYLNWNRPAKDFGPCLVIPFAALDGGDDGFHRLKPDKPRKSKSDAKLIKYESPVKKPNRAYFPPGTIPTILTEAAPLVITEGEKKALALTQAGYPAIGLVGVFGWQLKRADKTKPRKLIKDLAGIAWKGRPITIVFDSDVVE